MTTVLSVGSIEWFIKVIEALPSDPPVPLGTPGYNQYTTQKSHWLGWLDPTAGTGSYPRSTGAGRDAKYVYNHIVEPKLLLWLVSAAGVQAELVALARASAEAAKSMAGKSAAVRRQIPWATVCDALLKNCKRMQHNPALQRDAPPASRLRAPELAR